MDEYYVGSPPETIYFDQNRNPVPDNIKVSGSGGYDETAVRDRPRPRGRGIGPCPPRNTACSYQACGMERSCRPPVLGKGAPPIVGGLASAMLLSSLSVGGQTYYDYNENGGGEAGGPQGIWMTFFNGYTAVELSNTRWGQSNVPYQVMEQVLTTALH